MTAEDPVAMTARPQTGRRGAFVLYVVGIALVAAAGLFALRLVRGHTEATSADADQRQHGVAAGPLVIVGSVQSLAPGRRA